MKINTCRGISLVEVGMTMAVVALVVAGVAGSVLVGRATGKDANDQKLAKKQATQAVSSLAADIRKAGDMRVESNGRETHIYFKRATDGDVSYHWDNSGKELTRTAKGQTRVVATSISALTVTDSGSTVSVQATSTGDTTSPVAEPVTVTETVTSGSTGGATGSTSGVSASGSTGGASGPTSSGSTGSPTESPTEPVQQDVFAPPFPEAPAPEEPASSPVQEEPVQEGPASSPPQEEPVQEGPVTPPAPDSITTHGMSIPAAHPRLWWNAERLAKARAWLAANPFNATSNFEIAWKHVVAGTSCAPAINWAMTFQVPYAQWQPSANGSDQARWNGETAAIIYDWCFDELTEQQKSDFWENIAASGYGWNDYLTGINQQNWGGPAMVDSNYNWGNLRNNIEFGIAGRTENPTYSENFLDNGIDVRWTQYFVPASSVPKLVGGVPGEGDAYGTSIPNAAIIPFQSMGLLGRNIFSESDYFKQFVYYVIYATTPAETYHRNTTRMVYQIQTYGDDEQYASGGMLDIRNYYQDIMNFYSNLYSNIGVGKDARQWWNTVTQDSDVNSASKHILAQDNNPSGRPTTNLPLDYYSTGIKYLYGRKAWDTSSAYFFIQMGSATEHTHSDVGNFHIWRGGRWLTRETTGYCNTIAGYGYRTTMGTTTGTGCGDGKGLLAHNTIAFGTPLYGDTDFMPSRPKGDGVVTRLESATDYSYAVVDMTDKYLWSNEYASSNPGAVVHVEREFLFLRGLETTVILDRITTGDVIRGIDTGLSAANQVNTFSLHSETNPTLEDSSHITITNGDQVLRVTTLVPSNPTRRVIDEDACTGCTPGIGIYRIELDTSGHAQRYFLNVLQARSSSGSNITASVVDSNPSDPTTGTFTVTLQPASGNATTIVFNKGQTSSGGTVNIAGSGVKELRTNVQQILYTDNGPVWVW